MVGAPTATAPGETSSSAGGQSHRHGMAARVAADAASFVLLIIQVPSLGAPRRVGQEVVLRAVLVMTSWDSADLLQHDVDAAQASAGRRPASRPRLTLNI